MKKSTPLKIALGTAAFAGLVGNIACEFAIKRPDSNKPKKPETRQVYIQRAETRKRNNQHLYDSNPEDLTIKSVQGFDMKAWFVPVENSKRFVICVHGYRCDGPDEFSHMFPFYHDTMGYNYLLPDLTGHGRSGGNYACFGAIDAKNILLWVDYLIDRFGEDIEIILHGISMGAATVMNCNEMSPPDQVKIVIEDCGFINAIDEMNNTLKDMIGFKFKPIVLLGSLATKMRAGYFFSESDPLGNMYKAKNPVLFIHGEEDKFVPFRYGKMLYDACPTEKDFLWVPNTVHAFSYYNAKDEYEQKVKDFIKKHMDKTVTV